MIDKETISTADIEEPEGCRRTTAVKGAICNVAVAIWYKFDGVL